MATLNINRYYGIYRAQVFDNADPDDVRKLRLIIPQISGDAVSKWVLPMDANNTAATLPPVGSGVWVQFEAGDPSYPVWLGSFG
jgi:hypothetical protein